jgi:hypothetical protein
MDKRETIEKSGFLKDLEDKKEYEDKVTENGVSFRIPYKIIKQATFSNISKMDLIDIEHSARLQYRLMLQDPVIKARVEFIKQRIIVIYNPPEAENRKPKMSLDDIKSWLAKEGVYVDNNQIENVDYDYYKNIYSYQFNPATIREHAPYGYSREEWQHMKPKWEKKKEEYSSKKKEKFHNFQINFLKAHPEIAQNSEIKQQSKE